MNDEINIIDNDTYYDFIINEYNYFISESTASKQYKTFKIFINRKKTIQAEYTSIVEFNIKDILDTDNLYFLDLSAQRYFNNITVLDSRMMEYNNYIMIYFFNKIDIESLLKKKNIKELKIIQSILFLFEEYIDKYQKYKGKNDFEGDTYNLLIKHYKQYNTKDIKNLLNEVYPEYNTAMA